MSNCDFYAVKDDMISLLDFIYDGTDCRVYESYSEYGKELREFKSTADLLNMFNLGQCKTWSEQVLLQLYSTSAKGKFLIEKINLDPKKCEGHTVRYNVGGWGLIQLYLGGVFEAEKKIVHSHLGHNSETRAKKWESTYPNYGKTQDWDWKTLNATSRKITNHITKKLSGKKECGRSVLSNALVSLDSRYSFI